MKSPDTPGFGPKLTDADRRAIAEIRRKIDAEFRAKLDAECGPQRAREPAFGTRSATRRARERARARRVFAIFLFGMLAGAVVSGIAALLWDQSAEPKRVVSETPTPVEDVHPEPRAAVTPWVVVDDVALLRDALGQWIDATRRGDIATQMRFYPERVPVYYTWRNVPRDAVRSEKDKVFGAASRLVMTTDRPALEIAEDGLTATTRFRKRYVIEGPAIRRRGEVLQELRWTRTATGWVIVGERDARVLRRG